MSKLWGAFSYLPIDLAIAGRKMELAFRGVDAVLGAAVADVATIATPWGDLAVEPHHRPQRFLIYFLENSLRYYRKSPLGAVLASLYEPGATFIDVGANLGLYGLVARELGYYSVEVEPEPGHSAYLTKNESLFGKVLPVAFSDQPGELPLYYNKDNSGATSLMPAPNFVKGAGVVPVTTFSAAADRNDMGDPAAIKLVKVDVEGFEAEAVRGMEPFLAAGYRPHIWCEVRGDLSGRNKGSYRKVTAILEKYGYKAWDYKNGGPVQPVDEELASREVFDLYYTPSAS